MSKTATAKPFAFPTSRVITNLLKLGTTPAIKPVELHVQPEGKFSARNNVTLPVAEI